MSDSRTTEPNQDNSLGKIAKLLKKARMFFNRECLVDITNEEPKLVEEFTKGLASGGSLADPAFVQITLAPSLNRSRQAALQDARKQNEKSGGKIRRGLCNIQPTFVMLNQFLSQLKLEDWEGWQACGIDLPPATMDENIGLDEPIPPGLGSRGNSVFAEKDKPGWRTRLGNALDGYSPETSIAAATLALGLVMLTFLYLFMPSAPASLLLVVIAGAAVLVAFCYLLFGKWWVGAIFAALFVLVVYFPPTRPTYWWNAIHAAQSTPSAPSPSTPADIETAQSDKGLIKLAQTQAETIKEQQKLRGKEEERRDNQIAALQERIKVLEGRRQSATAQSKAAQGGSSASRFPPCSIVVNDKSRKNKPPQRQLAAPAAQNCAAQ